MVSDLFDVGANDITEVLTFDVDDITGGVDDVIGNVPVNDVIESVSSRNDFEVEGLGHGVPAFCDVIKGEIGSRVGHSVLTRF